MDRRRILCVLIGTSMIAVIAIVLSPLHIKTYNLALLASVVSIWLGTLKLLSNRKYAKLILISIAIVIGLAFVVPGRDIDTNLLHRRYVQNLVSYEGSDYYWGGENRRGIDCSGLPRRSYRDALLSRGIKKFNSRAIRAWFEQWWFDTSAKALGEGYREFTTPLSPAGTIREMDYSKLKPGDLAVTRSGVHVLVYLGEGKWIQADPGAGKVVVNQGRTGKNAWLGVEVSTHRWRLLE